MRAETVRPVFIVCPHCGKSEHRVQHLYDTSKERGKEVSFGPWQCDECQHEFSGTVLYNPGHVTDPCEVTITSIYPWIKVPKLSLLRFRDLYVVVDSYSDHKPGEKDSPWYDFLFHSHQCPTNILRSVEEVFDDEGRDPHGVLRFVAAIDDTEENRKRLDAAPSKEKLFELFGTDGKDAPSDWPEVNKGVLPWLAEAQRERSGVPLGAGRQGLAHVLLRLVIGRKAGRLVLARHLSQRQQERTSPWASQPANWSIP